MLVLLAVRTVTVSMFLFSRLCGDSLTKSSLWKVQFVEMTGFDLQEGKILLRSFEAMSFPQSFI